MRDNEREGLLVSSTPVVGPLKLDKGYALKTVNELLLDKEDALKTWCNCSKYAIKSLILFMLIIFRKGVISPSFVRPFVLAKPKT